MNSANKLLVIGAIVILTVIYSFMIAYNSNTAQEVMLGYCGLVLTAFAIVQHNRDDHDR